MPQQENGAKWLFWLAMVFMALALTLGLMVSHSEWLQPQIADATASQMRLTTEIERRKADIALQTLKDQAANENIRQLLALQAQVKSDQQVAEWRQNMYAMINIGLLALMIAFSIVATVFGIFAALTLYKKQTITLSQPQPVLTPAVPAVQPVHRQASPAAIQARKCEQKNRLERKLLSSTRPYWSRDDGKSPELISGVYPWTN
jgi:disulfide bond formation protein DsbB